MTLERLYCEQLLGPADFTPSADHLKVTGAFNPGAAATGNDDEVAMLVRVTEDPVEQRDGQTGLPRWEDGRVVIDWLDNDDLRFIDPRVVEVKATGNVRLTFTSHLRLVHLPDGKHIDRRTLDADPAMIPEHATESYGVEDPRITPLDGRFYITYVAASPHGACTALASTDDFAGFQRHGVIFPPENKDILLFPRRIDGQYVAIHRPNPSTHFTPPEMWLGRSADLTHWGQHEVLVSTVNATDWSIGRIGGGCPPLETDRGWVEVYHGNNKKPGSGEGEVGAYVGAALLMDRENPGRILGRSQRPIMIPEADFETSGFVRDVVFPTGIVDRGETVLIYYGAADKATGVVEWSKRELLDRLT
jgi:predicted GH43/DUF377 family glycosyl hydrolase